ncbi:transposase [Pseudomonas prosekii]|uniref:Transposase n=1 Tax=Pseudomonas prosekii TaxID=1148509 RepID=A0A2U2D6F7_9PSED|nr:transposase [Pseudomonas prosekii]PWE43397.1 transposase [Pseudomonas prosekii]
MNPKDFVIGLKTTVVEENLSIYKDLFSSTSIKDVTDEYWKRALTLFNSLPAEQREVFFEVIRQTMADTTSNILGVIDGVSIMNDEDDEFSLTYGDDKKSLSGDLQSLFLAEEETV